MRRRRNYDAHYANRIIGVIDPPKKVEVDSKNVFPKGFKPNKGSQTALFKDLLNCPINKDGTINFKPYKKKVFSIYYRAGVGSGKTFSGAAFVASRAMLHPRAIGLITANSFPQLKNSTLRGLAKFCEQYGIELTPKRGDYIDTAKRIADNQYCKINGVHHDVLSVDAFVGRTQSSQETGRGTEYAWAWGDELSYAPGSAFDTILERVRWEGIKNVFLITSTINKNNPFNWIYDLFDSPKRTDDQRKLYVSLAGSTTENEHNLTEDYVARLRASLTPELFDIEVNSKYAVDSKHLCFKYFRRDLHAYEDTSLFRIKRNRPLHLSFDFNYSPSCCLAAQEYAEEVRIIREWYEEDCGTIELIKRVIKWLPPGQMLVIHGDATGNQKTANSKRTNWQIIHEGLKKAGYKYQLAYGLSNPNVDDTINEVNVAFLNDWLILNKFECVELMKDLETLKKNPKTNEIDKKDQARSHEADCLRYLIHDLLPMNLRIPRSGHDLNGEVLY